MNAIDYMQELMRRKKELESSAQNLQFNTAMNTQGVPQLTEAQRGYSLGSFSPGVGLLDASGGMAPFPPNNLSLSDLPGHMANATPMPSMTENVSSGNYFDAVLQGLGAGGDALTAAGPLGAAVGLPAKALSRLGKTLRATNIPEDVPKVTFTGNSTPPAADPKTSRTIKTTGKYRGAPAHINSPQKLAAMQKQLRGYLKEGAPYREWYEKTNAWANNQLENRPGRLDQYGGTVAVTSSGTAVPSNAGFASKGYNQALMGDQVVTGRFPSAMGPSIDKIFSGTSPSLGPKREPFNQAVVQDLARARQTNDIRQARAFGYEDAEGQPWSAGLSDAQHRFMDEETAKLLGWAKENKIGGVDTWNADQIQAAIWISQKAEQDGTSIEQAAAMFENFTPQGTIRTEAAPSAGLDHLSGVLNDPEALAIYSDAQNAAMQTPGLLDYTTSNLGAMTDPTFAGPGIYEGASNPSFGMNVNIGKVKNSVGQEIIDPSSTKLLEGTAAMQGLLRAQDTVGYTAILPAKKAIDRDSLQIDLGRTVNQQEMVDIERQLKDEFGSADEFGTPNFMPLMSENGLEIIPSSPEVVKKFTQGVTKGTPPWQKQLNELVKRNFNAKETTWGVNYGGLVGDTDQWSYRPSQYLPYMENLSPDAQGLLNRGAAVSAPKLEQVDKVAAGVTGAGDRNPIVTLTRDALANGGIARVRELVQQGLLPAAVLTLLMQRDAQSPNQYQSQGLL